MINYKEVRLVYDSPAAPPEGIYMDRIYSIFKKYGKLYITDGNAEIEIDEFLLKMVFSLNNKIKWDDVDFSDEIRVKDFKK